MTLSEMLQINKWLINNDNDSTVELKMIFPFDEAIAEFSSFIFHTSGMNDLNIWTKEIWNKIRMKS